LEAKNKMKMEHMLYEKGQTMISKNYTDQHEPNWNPGWAHVHVGYHPM